LNGWGEKMNNEKFMFFYRAMIKKNADETNKIYKKYDKIIKEVTDRLDEEVGHVTEKNVAVFLKKVGPGTTVTTEYAKRLIGKGGEK